MSHEEILAALQEQFPDEVVGQAPGLNFTVVVKPERLVQLATFLRDQAGMDFLSNLTAVDRSDRFEVVYHLYSTKNPAPPFALKVMLPDKANPRLPSVTSVWEGANFQEREAYDLLGIVFDGHPKLERLLLWDGFPGHPLRKDFVNRTFTFEEISRTLPPDDKR